MSTGHSDALKCLHYNFRLVLLNIRNAENRLRNYYSLVTFGLLSNVWNLQCYCQTVLNLVLILLL